MVKEKEVLAYMLKHNCKLEQEAIIIQEVGTK